MKKPLITRFKNDFLGQVFGILDQFVVKPTDDVEINVLATKEDVKIIFRIVKKGADKPNETAP